MSASSTPVFSFGHPCEHQLRRTCIGGINCPLNGYPDTWCCSYVKGKINFKRDKPCEGPRCRWGFVHPPQQSFDTVTQLIADARALNTKFEDITANGEGGVPTTTAKGEILSFQMDSAHLIDSVHCTMHFLRIPAASCGRLIGQMFAYAASKTHDPKVFTTLLRTMKKPVDVYLIGAYEYTEQQLGQREAQRAKLEESGKKAKKKAQDDVLDDLKTDLVEIMNSALSSGGQLVDRLEQRPLQAIFICALKTFPKNRKKPQEMLERAMTKFTHPCLDPPSPERREAAAKIAIASAPSLPTADDEGPAAADGGESTTATTQGEGPASTPPMKPAPPSPQVVSHKKEASGGAAPLAPVSELPELPGAIAGGSATAKQRATPPAPAADTASGKARTPKAPSAVAESPNDLPPTVAGPTTTQSASATQSGTGKGAAKSTPPNQPARPAAIGTPEQAVLPAAATPPAAAAAASPKSMATRAGPAPADASPDTFVSGGSSIDESGMFGGAGNPVPTAKAGLSKFEIPANQPTAPYYPIITGSVWPDISIAGGLFGLGPRSAKSAPLGAATLELAATVAAATAATETNSPPSMASGSVNGSIAAAAGSSGWHVDPLAGSPSRAAAAPGAVGTPPTMPSFGGGFPSFPSAPSGTTQTGSEGLGGGYSLFGGGGLDVFSSSGAGGSGGPQAIGSGSREQQSSADDSLLQDVLRAWQ